MGVLVQNASVTELTRTQARRLEALNSIARAMTSTLDESSVLTGLYATLRELLPVDALEMVTLQDGEKVRHVDIEADAPPTSRWLPPRSPLAANAREVVDGAKPVLVHHPNSSLWVPLKEGGASRGALGITCSRAYAYEDSTAAFLEAVSDEVTLALRYARTSDAIDDHRT